MEQLTRTEAETLAVMLDSASRHMARAIKPTWDPGYSRQLGADNHVWSMVLGTPGREALEDMFAGFYEIAPDGVYV